MTDFSVDNERLARTVQRARAALYFLITLAMYLGLPLLGWGLGDLGSFFSLSVRAGYAALVLAIAMAIGYVALAAPEAIKGEPAKEGGKSSFAGEAWCGRRSCCCCMPGSFSCLLWIGARSA